ncbi:unnamed protein product [Brassica napus]|uniref:(rape) hypothetical protein n=1 Tax=Brassica napus TaxID=3708 RepID=A0A817AR37_BRANA|nr:unnamed protein product [Brassica napus]
MAKNPSSKIPKDRLMRYMNYRLPKVAWGKIAYKILMRSVKSLSVSSWAEDSYEVKGFTLAINLWAMSSVNVLGKSLVKPCETSSSSDPLCLHWDSISTPTITEVLELEKKNNVEVNTVIGLGEEYKHLVGATHIEDADFHSVVKLVQQGYKMKRKDWVQGFVDMFVATEDIGQKRNTNDKDGDHGEDLNHSEDEEEKKDEEKKKDEDHSMSDSEKLDKLIQMVRNLDKRVLVIQNTLRVKFNDGSPNKEDCENGASSGDRRSAQANENEEDTIDEEANSGDKKSAQDDENEEEICDEEAKSDEDTEKLESESCLKQTSQVMSPTPTFNTPNFDTRVTSPTPTFMSPKFDLLSQESRSGKDGSEEHIEAGFEMLKLRQINNPDLFLNKTALVVGVKFLEEIDELYDEFLDDKKVSNLEQVLISTTYRKISIFSIRPLQ